MPTGYTCGVADGTITDFKVYAMQCARNFGACIMLRDDPLSPEIPELKPSDYYFTNLEESKKSLASFKAMDESQRRAVQSSKRQSEIDYAKSNIEKRNETLKRYQAMLHQARQFVSPTKEHDGYAQFIVQQLEDSIEWDCNTQWAEETLSKPDVPFEQWEAEHLAHLEEEVVDRQRYLDEELARVARNNAWVNALKKALGVS